MARCVLLFFDFITWNQGTELVAIHHRDHREICSRAQVRDNDRARLCHLAAEHEELISLHSRDPE